MLENHELSLNVRVKFLKFQGLRKIHYFWISSQYTDKCNALLPACCGWYYQCGLYDGKTFRSLKVFCNCIVISAVSIAYSKCINDFK